MNERYPLVKLVVALVVVAATIPAYAQPRLNCADWLLNRDGSWQPRRQVIIGNVMMGTNVFIYQSASYVIQGTNIVATLNARCRRRRNR